MVAGHSNNVSLAGSKPVPLMHIQALDKLTSQADRTALAEAVCRELSAPLDLSRVYGRLVSESLHAQAIGPNSDLERVIAQATAEQVHWLGGGLRQEFLSRATRMFEWSHRLGLIREDADWSPRLWVEAARELEIEGELLCLVIERADTLAWPAWNEAFAWRRCWAAQWSGWEQAFARSPGLASRWLHSVLSPPASETPAEHMDRLERLSFSRGRLWQKIYVSAASGHASKLLGDLDARLASVGARRRLDCVDYTSLLRQSGKLVSPGEARASLMGFLSSSADSATDWLSDLLSEPGEALALGSDRAEARGLAALSWLASHGQCDARKVQAVFDHWATLLDDADWRHVFDDAFLAAFGLSRPVDEELPSVPPSTSKAKQKSVKANPPPKSLPVPSSPAPAPQPPQPSPEPAAPMSNSPEPLPAIPRFSQRR